MLILATVLPCTEGMGGAKGDIKTNGLFVPRTWTYKHEFSEEEAWFLSSTYCHIRARICYCSLQAPPGHLQDKETGSRSFGESATAELRVKDFLDLKTCLAP